MFPGMNAEHLATILEHLRTKFEEVGPQFDSLAASITFILPADDSSLQWSPIGAGATSDPKGTLQKIFERMVMRYHQ